MSSRRQSLRIEAPDATYKSLSALLASPAASAISHLALIGAPSLSTSITHYLATLPTDEASKFAQILVTSNAMWSGAQQSSSSSSSSNVSTSVHDSSEDVNLLQGQTTTLLARAQLLFEATARAVLGRMQVVVQQNRGDLGWNTQRSFVAWIRALTDAVHADPTSVPGACDGIPITSLALQTGIVAGLQAARAQRKANDTAGHTKSHSSALSTRYALRRAEQEWCTTLTECAQMLADTLRGGEAQSQSEEDAWQREFRKVSLRAGMESGRSDDPHKDPQVVTLFLAAQVSPYVNASRLTVLPPETLIIVLSDSLLGLFERSKVMHSIREDVHQGDDGKLVLHSTSATVQRASVTTAHPLFAALGPLSRLLSLAFSAITRTLSPLQVQDALLAPGAPMTRMYKLAQSWQNAWFGCRLAGAQQEEIVEASRSQTKLLWNVFKTILFSYTMIFDALMEAIVDVCPTPTETRQVDQAKRVEEQDTTKWAAATESNIPPTYLESVCLVLKTYARLSWITATFGSSAFDAYRRVFYEALEVLSRDGRASIALCKELMPLSLSEGSAAFETNAARRAEAVFFLDTAEQLMVQLPDDMVEDVILPACRPYLDDRTYQEAFESSHSAILSIFATDKECLLELTPYYTRLLLTCFPSSLSVEQLSLAFSTVMDAVSDRSDTVAWHTLEQLWREIETEQYSMQRRGTDGGPAKQILGTALTAGASAAVKEEEEGDDVDDDVSTKRERDLSDVYVAQVQNVNLVLLRSTLSNVRRLIMRQTRGGEARLHLCEKTFASLAGLDASTREEGVRWWLEERERFGV